MNGNHMRGVQPCRGVGFAAESSLKVVVVREVSVQDFDRDDPVGVGVTGAPHLAHAAAAQQLDQAITSERRLVHRLTIRSQPLHRWANEQPETPMATAYGSALVGVRCVRGLGGPALPAAATPAAETTASGGHGAGAPAGVEGVGAAAGEYQKEEREAVQDRGLAAVAERGQVRREAVGQMLGEVGERHLARRNEGRNASEESNGDEKAGDQFDDAGPPQRPRSDWRRWAHGNRPGEEDRRAVKGEEDAEHDAEETQYRLRMRIESGVQVLRHVPTIRRDLLSAAFDWSCQVADVRRPQTNSTPLPVRAARARARHAPGEAQLWRSASASRSRRIRA